MFRFGTPRRTCWLLVSLGLVLATTPETPAFDGARKGLVIGFGTGISPMSSLSTSYQGHDFSSSDFGVGVNLILGYGINKRDVLAAEFNLTSYSSTYGESSTGITQGIGALTWYRYFGEEGESFFAMAGMGAYRAMERAGIRISICINCPDAPEAGIPERWGLGLITGVGREISDRWQIVAYGAIGYPSGYVYVPSYSYATNRVTAAHINLLLIWMHF